MRQLYPTDATSRMVLHSLRVFQGFRRDHRGRRRGVRPVRCAPRGGRGPARRAGANGGGAARAGHRHAADRPRRHPRARSADRPLRGGGRGLGARVGIRRSDRRDRRVCAGGRAGRRHHRAGGGGRGRSTSRGGAIEGVRLASGERIAARVVVNAAGLWSPAVASLAGRDAARSSWAVIPVFVVQRAPEFGRPHPVYLDLSSGTFLRPETGGLTLTGFLDADETNHPLDPEALGARWASTRWPGSWSGPAGASPRLGRRDTSAGTRAPSTSPRTGCRSSTRRRSAACTLRPACPATASSSRRPWAG